MKKVIFVHLLNDFSGSPKVLSQVIKSVESNKVEVELYTGKNTIGFLTNSTENHSFFRYKRFENKYLTLLFFLLSQVSIFFKLLKYWRKDVDIYVNTMLPFGAGIAGWLMKKRVVYHIHETCLTPKLLKLFLRGIIKLTAKELIFVSESVKDLESFENKRQSVVYNGLSSDFQNIGSVHTYTPKYDGSFNVLMLASMKAYKGVFEFLEVAKLLEKNRGVSFTLVLNASKSGIDAFFESVEVPENIAIFSQQSDVIPFYKKSNLVLNLSRPDQWVETFGLTVLEALSFGVPVIVPPVGGPSEIVNEGKEGFLISSYETNKIAQKIIELSTDTQVCMELSQNAKKRALDFSENKFNKEISNVITSK